MCKANKHGAGATRSVRRVRHFPAEYRTSGRVSLQGRRAILDLGNVWAEYQRIYQPCVNSRRRAINVPRLCRVRGNSSSSVSLKRLLVRPCWNDHDGTESRYFTPRTKMKVTETGAKWCGDLPCPRVPVVDAPFTILTMDGRDGELYAVNECLYSIRLIFGGNTVYQPLNFTLCPRMFTHLGRPTTQMRWEE